MEELLRKLVEFPTVTADVQASHEGIDFIASFVVARGMYVERFVSNGYESLVATPVAGRKTPKVLLSAHVDVVPAPPEQFALRREHGRYYGRGVMDMKFAIAGYLWIIDQLQGQLDKYDFGLMITSDEEEGGFDGVAKLIEQGYLPKVCLLPDGGENWQVQTSANGFLSVKLVARSTAVHGSRPWLAKNPATQLLRALLEMQALFDPNPEPGMNTMSITNLKAGDGALTQAPEFAEATIDIRTRTEPTRRQLQADLQAICQQHEVELSYPVASNSTEFKLQNPYIAPYVKLIEQHTGLKVHGSHAVASSDARFFAAQGVPCISFYPTGAGLHGPEEWIDATALDQFATITRAYLENVAKVDPK